MPVTPTYPGVYIQELSSGVRTITGVATSIAAFIDDFSRGPMNQAVQCLSAADFERNFGGLDSLSEASYGIQQFFLNGGGEAWVVRVAAGAPAKANVTILNGIGGAATTGLTVTAASEGKWGEAVRVRVDSVTADPNGTFNLSVTEYATVGGRSQAVRQETFRNLTMSSASPSFVETVVNAASALVQVAAAGSSMPQENGTVSNTVGATVTLTTAAAKPAVNVTIGADTAVATFGSKPAGAIPLSQAAGLLEAAIRSAKPDKAAFAAASVLVEGTRLRVLAGPGAAGAKVTFAAAAGDAQTVTDLQLTGASVASNVQEYTLGGGAVASTAQSGGASGNNGTPPGAAELIGSLVPKTGLYALEGVDLFNILCIPRTAQVSGANAITATEAATVISTATAYCQSRRAFLVIDTPSNVTTPQGIKDWLNTNATLRDRNVALYYPRVQIADPLNNFLLRAVGASGTAAGIFARTDSERGVWKAPAGVDAVLRNVQALDYKLTDGENGTLNPLAINCLRNFPVYGNVAWGSRTLDGADQQASEWKYVPVRRFALFLEESLYRGTKWVVFEPNDEPLWSQIRLNIGAFMQNLFRQGAFQGQTPKEAYFVKCDKETTTQNDINLGIVNIVVGFAPLKPAEFVIISIQQIAGQIQA